MAARTGISDHDDPADLGEAGLKPHRTETFKWSTDPELVPKVRDVVGLYLAPPERAIVLSVDEKTQIQALDRTQPMLPLRPGQVERHTHDYERHGTTSLFAALNVATGEVTHEARARHTGADFLAFLRRVDRVYPDAELHVILDNVCTHKTPGCPGLARAPSADHLPLHPDLGVLDEPGRDVVQRPQPAGHPPGQLSERQGAHRVIDTFTASWNAGASPFTWVKTADEILAKAVRKRPATNEPGH